MIRKAWRELIVENPIVEEGARARRKVFRTGDARTANRLALVGFAVLYLYGVAQIFRYRVNVTPVFMVLTLLVFTVVLPCVLYGAVALEREKATWESLILTRLTPAQIVAGKLAWRLAAVLVTAAFVGATVLVSQFAGPKSQFVPWSVVLWGHLQLVGWSLLVSAFSLWVSAHSRRAVTALAIIAGGIIGVLIFLPALLSMFGVSMGAPRDLVGWAVANSNPFYVLGNALDMSSPWADNGDAPALRWWRVALPGAYSALAGVLLWATARKLRQLEEPHRNS